MAKYTVVIHYEGAWECTVEAEDEYKARELAEQEYEDTPLKDTLDGLMWDVCDVWEEEE